MITAAQAIEEAKEITEQTPDEMRQDLIISVLAHRMELLSARLDKAEDEIRTFLAAS